MVDFNYTGGLNMDELSVKMKGQEAFQTTLKIKNKVGDSKFFLCSFSPIINLKDEVDLFMGILNDVTEQVNLELNWKRQLEAERKKTAFGSEYNEDNEKVTHQFESILEELSAGEVNIDTMLSNDRLPIIIASTDGMVKKASNQAGIIFNMRDELISTQSIANLIDFENDDVKYKVLGFINQGGGCINTLS